MNPSSTSRDLMFGFVAVRQRYLTADKFIDAVCEWSRGEKNDSLVQWLVESGALSETQRDIVSLIADSDCDDALSTLGPEAIDTDAINADSFATELAALNNQINQISDLEVRASLVDFMTLIGPEVCTAPSRSSLTEVSEQNRFQIRRKLARGGLGQVFIARDKQLNRNVAVKQILGRWQDDSGSKDRFLNEAEITGRLEHPGVVPVYALGSRPDGRYYYAMRLIRGVTLEDEIRKFFDTSASRSSTERNLELRKLLRRFIDVCNTMEYAHSRGVIHRDLKPANIMLGKYGETMVVDWGLAKRVDVQDTASAAAESLLVPSSGSGTSGTRAGSTLGTPQFMSPEQASGDLDLVGPASDIYGLGSTFYQLLTGQPPQTDKSLPRVLDNVKRGEFPTPTSVLADVEKPLEAICLKAMQTRQNQRYASAAEMAQEIERWLADQRVLAYHEPMLSKVARSVRYHQTAAASGTVAIVLLCVAAVVGSIVWQQQQTRRRAHVYELEQQQTKREQEAQQHLAERRSNAAANLRFGLVEAKAGRFESALKFFRQGEQACAGDSRLDGELRLLERPAQQMLDLVEFQRLSNDAIMASALQENFRAMDLIASAIRHLGVFDHADWWNHLPADYLSRQEADRIEKQVHFDLVTLASLLAKSVPTKELVSFRILGLPYNYSSRQRQLKQSINRLTTLAQTYRESEWLQRIEDSVRFLYGEINRLPTKHHWQADNFVDTYYLGATCTFATPLEGTAMDGMFLREMLGISDPRHAATMHLHRATELEPNNYLAHLLLGFDQSRAGAFDAARSTLSHCIALRPDLILAYDWRSITCLTQAKQTDDLQLRDQLLKSALHDANVVCQIAPRFEIGYWIRGNALRELNQNSQAVAAYMAALQREPAVDMIQEIEADAMLISMHGRELHEVRRLGKVLPNRFEDARRYAQQLRQDDPEDIRSLNLDATAALALYQWDDAQDLAMQALDLLSCIDQDAVTIGDMRQITAQAHAIRGEVHRNLGESTLARDEFINSLRYDPQNTLAAEGLALALSRLAENSNDPVQIDRAYEAYDRLAEVACTDWQSIRAYQGHYALLLKQGNFEAAANALETALQIDRGQRFGKLVELAKKHNATDILKRFETLDFVSQLASVSDEQRRPKTLALRNGDFELGLDVYWDAWKCSGGCFSEAKTDDYTRPGAIGENSLRIQHHTQRSTKSFATLQQAIPVLTGTRYRISVWAKSDEMAADGLNIVLDDILHEPLIVLPEGKYDWQLLTGEFFVTGALDLDHPDTRRIKIVSSAPGKVWLDDVQIERMID